MSEELLTSDANLSAYASLARALSSAYNAAFPGQVAETPRAAVGALATEIGRLREELEQANDRIVRLHAACVRPDAGAAALRQACEAVMFFWEKDPAAFGDAASVTSLAGRFASVADQVRRALEASETEHSRE